jgi:hypothetical protein
MTGMKRSTPFNRSTVSDSRRGITYALALTASKLSERGGRRVVVLLTDGLDSGSKTSRHQAMTALERTGTSVFVVAWEEVLRFEITGAISWMNAHERQSSSLYKRMA